MGPRRRKRAAGDPDGRRPPRRADLLGELLPLARFALYESGIEIYVASTADDGDAWQATLVHIAREARSFVVSPSHFQRSSAYPDHFPLRDALEGHDVLGRGGSAILGPDGSYLAGPLYDEERILTRTSSRRASSRRDSASTQQATTTGLTSSA